MIEKANKEDLDLILKMWNEGSTATEIGRVLHITRNAVIGRVGRARAAGWVDIKPKVMPKETRRSIYFQRIEERKVELNRMQKSQQEQSINNRHKLKGKTIPFPHREKRMVMEPLTPPTNDPIYITDLKIDSCRYIIGDVDDADTLYCGAKVHRASMCPYHYSLCYHPAPFKKPTIKAA